MKARIVRIGNSRGVRLPKMLIEHAGLPEEVELLAEQDHLIDALTATRFDERKWVWR